MVDGVSGAAEAWTCLCSGQAEPPVGTGPTKLKGVFLFPGWDRPAVLQEEWLMLETGALVLGLP